jgi:hypothetical protein
LRHPSRWAAECVFPADFLGLGEDMGDADLPVHCDSVIGGIAVAHQGPVKDLSEDGFGHLGRAMPVVMEASWTYILTPPKDAFLIFLLLGGFCSLYYFCCWGYYASLSLW